MVKQALWSTLLGSQLGPCKVIRHLKPLIYLCAKLSFEVSQFHAVLVNALLQPQSNPTGLLARNSITYLLVGLLAFNKFSSRIDHNYRIMSGDSHSSCQNSGARQDTGYKEATWFQNFILSKRLVRYKKSSSFSHFKSSPRSTSPGRARVRITICFMMRAPPSLFSRLDKLSSFPSHLSLSLSLPPSPSLFCGVLPVWNSVTFYLDPDRFTIADHAAARSEIFTPLLITKRAFQQISGLSCHLSAKAYCFMHFPLLLHDINKKRC